MDWIEHREPGITPLLPTVRQEIRQIERGVGMDALSFEEVLREQEALIIGAQASIIDDMFREHVTGVVEGVDVELRRAFRTRNKRAVRELSEDLIALRQGADDGDA